MRWGILFFLLAAPAAAGPYDAWAANLERVAPGAAEAAHLESAPGLARIWAYGHVGDTVDPRVPAEARADWRARLDRVAEALDDPTLKATLADPRLAAQVEAAIVAAEPLLAHHRAGAPVPVMLAVVERGAVARLVFYGALFRAGLAAGRPTDPEPVQALLGLARQLATGRALTRGQLDWFADLAAFHGGEVPPRGGDDAEVALTRLLGARLAGDQRALMSLGEEALKAAERRRGRGLLTALVQNFGAYAAGWGGRPEEERAIRVQVLQSVRPLGKPRLTAALISALILPHLEAGRVDGALAFVDELVTIGPPALTDREVVAALEAAADGVERTLAKPGPRDTRRLVHAAERIAAVLARPEVPAADAATRRARNLGWARQRVRAATVALDEARPGDAIEMLAEPLRVADGPLRVARRRLRARALALEGRGEEAIAAAHAWLAEPGLTAADRAEARLQLGRMRLAAGEDAPAFANANAGLRAAPPAASGLRHALHRLAAEALHASGRVEASLERLRFASRLGPDAETARLLALVSIQLGDLDGAARAAEQVPPPAADRARVWRGCLLAGGGRDAAAQAALAELGPGLSRRGRLEGRLCLAALHLGARRHDAAARALKQARPEALALADPRLSWRIRALEARLALAEGKPRAAAGLWTQAARTWSTLAGERADRGFPLAARSFALPAGLGDEGVAALVASAAADPQGAAGHQRAALAAATWVRARDAVPPIAADEERAGRTAADLERRRSLGLFPWLDAALRPPTVRGPDRARAQARYAIAAAQAEAARRRLAVEEASTLAYLDPGLLPDPRALSTSGEEVRLFFHFSAARGHLWLSAPGVPIRHYSLPGAAAVRTLLAPARAALRRPAEAPDWGPFRAPVPILLPFLADPAVAAEVDQRTWWIVPDGPLLDFPLEALALAGGEDGGPPVFLASRHPIRRALVTGPRPAFRSKEGLVVVGPEDAEAQAVVAAGGGRRAPANRVSLRQSLGEHGVVVITPPLDAAAGRLSLTGEVAGRVDDAHLAFGEQGAEVVLFTHVVGEGADGLRRVVAALHHRGVRDVGVLLDRRSGDVAATAALAGPLARGEALGEILDQRRAEAVSRVDPAEHHPARWARWLHYAPLPTNTLDVGPTGRQAGAP